MEKERKLLETHSMIQQGTYFSDTVELERGVKFSSSRLIYDFYWNYAFNIDFKLLSSLKVQQLIKDYAHSINREAIVLIANIGSASNSEYINNTIKLEDEVWMTISKQTNWPQEKGLKFECEIIINPSSEFMEVFENSYSEKEENGLGYSSLPPEYLESIRNSKPIKGVEVAHFVGRYLNKPVAIASIYLHNGFAGLYNVGTLHEARRNSFGSLISLEAIKFAFKKNVKEIFLQTKADSEVEKMYEKIGFKRSFIGSYYRLQEE